MHNLLEFISRNNHWFLFVILEAISLTLLFQHNSYQGSVWFTSANYVTGQVYEASSEVESFFSLVSVNKELTQRNLDLERQVAALTEQLEQKAEDSILQQSEEMKVLSSYKLIPAKVIDNSINRPDNLITINKGAIDGIRKDMGVACGTGIVGVVYLVSQHYSIVIPVLNLKSNVSCKIKGRGYFGYLHWSGGSPTTAFMDDVPRHAHFRLGEAVVTSGYSSIFPPGLLVGHIQHVYNSQDGLSYRLMLKLSTDFGRVRDVCVIDNSVMEERLEVLRAAQDSIKEKHE